MPNHSATLVTVSNQNSAMLANIRPLRPSRIAKSCDLGSKGTTHPTLWGNPTPQNHLNQERSRYAKSALQADY